MITTGAGSPQFFAHRRQHSLAIGVGHLQAVLVHQMHDLNVGVGQPKQAEIAVDFAVKILDCAGLLGINFLDRAAGGDYVDALHQPCSFLSTATSTLPTTSKLCALSLSMVSFSLCQ